MYRKDTTIVIADDHKMLLSGLNHELTDLGYHIIDQAVDGAAALKSIVQFNPVIAILDIDMPIMSGLEVMKTCKNMGMDLYFILYSFHKEASFIAQAQKMGVHGYVNKEDAIEEIDHCIQAVLQGKIYISNSLSPVQQVQSSIAYCNRLTPSEIKILQLIAHGKKSQNIASDKNIGLRTVEKHRSNIINKLELNEPLNQWATTNVIFIDDL